MIEFLSTATISPPAEIDPDELADLKRREAAQAAKLAEQGVLVRAWRPHASATWANICLWRAADEPELWRHLGTLPLFPYMAITVQQLDPHPNDPAANASA